MVGDVSVYQIVTEVLPAGLTLQTVFHKILHDCRIYWSAISSKALYRGTAENLLLWNLMAATAFLVEHHHKLLLQ